MPDERARSADDYELMFAAHVLASLALTSLMVPLLERSAPSRVINVSSGGMYGQGIPVNDWQSELTSYGSKKFYARTKREEVVVSALLAEAPRDRGIIVHSMHPGWVDTEGVRRWMPVFRKLTAPIIRTPEQGADTIVWLGTTASVSLAGTGRFWHDRRPRPTHCITGSPPARTRRRTGGRCGATARTPWPRLASTGYDAAAYLIAGVTGRWRI